MQTPENTSMSRLGAGGQRVLGTYCKGCACLRAKQSRERAKKQRTGAAAGVASATATATAVLASGVAVGPPTHLPGTPGKKGKGTPSPKPVMLPVPRLPESGVGVGSVHV